MVEHPKTTAASTALALAARRKRDVMSIMRFMGRRGLSATNIRNILLLSSIEETFFQKTLNLESLQTSEGSFPVQFDGVVLRLCIII